MPFITDVSQGGLPVQEGLARVTEATREKAGALEGVGAAVLEWDTSKQLRGLFQPGFGDTNPEFKSVEAVQQLPMQLDKTELDFMLASRNQEEFQYKQQLLVDKRDRQRAMGDAPVSSFVTMMVDPVWLASDIATGFAGSAVRGGRVARGVAGATAGAGAALGLSLATAQNEPLSPGEILQNVLLNGAISGLVALPGGNGFKKADTAFPGDHLSSTAARIDVLPTDVPFATLIANVSGRTVADVAGTSLGLERTLTAARITDAFRIEQIQALGGKVEPGQVQQMQLELDRLNAQKTVLESPAGFKQEAKIQQSAGKSRKAAEAAARSVIAEKLDAIGAGIKRLSNTVQQNTLASQAEQNLAALEKGNIPPALATQIRDSATAALKNSTVEQALKSAFDVKAVPEDTVQKMFGLNYGETATPTVGEFGIPTGEVKGWSQRAGEFVEWSVRKSLASISPYVSEALVSSSVKKGARVSAEDEIIGIAQELSTFKYAVEDSVLQAMNAKGIGTLRSFIDPAAYKMQKKIEADVHLEMWRREWEASKGPVNMRDVDPVIAQIADKAQALVDKAAETLEKNGVAGAEGLRGKSGWLPRQWSAAKIQDMMNAVMRTGKSSDEAYEVVKDLVARSFQSANPGIKHRVLNKVESVVKAGGSAEDALNLVKSTLGKVDAAAFKTLGATLDRIASSAGTNAEKAILMRDATEAALTSAGVRPQTISIMAAATLDRALRKGDGVDPFHLSGHPDDVKRVVQDRLTEAGLSGEDIQDVMDAISGANAEKAKSGFLKHRIDMDYGQSVTIDGTTYKASDLLNTDLASNLDRYIDGVSADSGFARAGFKSQADLSKLRDRFLDEAKANGKDVAKAGELFDDTLNHLYGRPTGARINSAVRLGNIWTRMIALPWSAMWQISEYATAAGHYGLVKTAKYALQEMPGFKQFFAEVQQDAGTSSRLHDILSRNSYQDVRMRPFLDKFDDNFAITPSERVLSYMQRGSQLIPYLNGMKWVQQHQSRMVANLVVDRLTQAAKGEAKAVAIMKEYGMSPDIMERLKVSIDKSGTDVSKWDDGVWGSIRPIVGKMMDESVLKTRLGDTPAFAAFDSLGKFIFTFRSFTLTAHNKVLAGTLTRDGAGVLGLIMMYQFPLTMLGSAAISVMKGEKNVTLEELATRSMVQMGAMGLFGEIAGVVTGQRQQFGTPAFIAYDRLYRTGADVAYSLRKGIQGEDPKLERIPASILAATPLLGIVPGMQFIQNQLKVKE